MKSQIPIISIKAAVERANGLEYSQEQFSDISKKIDQACRSIGFFAVTDHGIDEAFMHEILTISKKFFALPQETKAKISMDNSRSWSGFFPMWSEQTVDRADKKEGIYFSNEDPEDDPRPLRAPNLFPDDELPQYRPLVLQYINKQIKLGHILMRCIANGLGLPELYFEQNITKDPSIQMLITHYPPGQENEFGTWEHTDYGLITMLCIGNIPGLQVKNLDGVWIDAPCPTEEGKYLMMINIGDMLERLSEYRYKSTLHRVKNTSGKSRITFPFFFNPTWEAVMKKLPFPEQDEEKKRWDGEKLSAWEGKFGEYFILKANRCFPGRFQKQVEVMSLEK